MRKILGKIDRLVGAHLEVLPGHNLLGEEAIDEVVGEEERLRHELELQVHFDEPIDQDGAHLVVDVRLDAHVVGRNLSVGLRNRGVRNKWSATRSNRNG